MVQQWRPRSNGNGQRDAGRRHGDAEAGESAEEGTRREETGDDAESSHEPAGDMHNEDAEQVVAGYEQDWDWNDGWYGNGWNGNRSQNYWNWNTGPWSETGWGTRRGSHVSRVEETTLVRDGESGMETVPTPVLARAALGATMELRRMEDALLGTAPTRSWWCRSSRVKEVRQSLEDRLEATFGRWRHG